jgi:hypothetical protein
LIIIAVCLVALWMYLFAWKGIGATTFPGSLAYRLSPWGRVALLAVSGSVTVVLIALAVRAQVLPMPAKGIVALALPVAFAFVVIFSGHVTRAEATEARKPLVVATEIVLCLGLVWAVSVASRGWP